MKFNLVFMMSVVSLGTTVVALCPTYWTPFDGHCYRIFPEKKTWVAAEATCTRIDAPDGQGIAHLASIHSAEEQEFVRTYWSTLRNENEERPGLWFGLNDIEQSDVWKWTDGSAFDPDQTFWLPNEPNNNDDGIAEDATALWGSSGGWNDLPRDSALRTFPFICKTPACACH